MMPLALAAPSYALLQASVTCWKCGEATPVTTVWVPSYVDFADVEEPEDEPEAGGAATLHGIRSGRSSRCACARDGALAQARALGNRQRHLLGQPLPSLWRIATTS